MSYKRFLKNVDLSKAKLGTSQSGYSGTVSVYDKYKNFLPMVYQGPQNRMERYSVYDGMENDPVISWSLDILSDYITQSGNGEPFIIKYTDGMGLTDSMTDSLEMVLKEWIKKQCWKKRIYTTIRDTLKYGDSYFIRDPETKELNRVNVYDVVGIVADELKTPTHYIIKNVDLNVPLKIASTASTDIQTKNFLNTLNINQPLTNVSQIQRSNNPNNDQTTLPVNAEHVVHISTNVDDILTYPYGTSILENVYKVYIQKMLLQDCLLLYRIKNATEKLVFNIPVGSVPRYKRKQFLEKCKNEMSQRRMPSRDSDGVFNTIDVAYNSIPMNEDYWLPVDSDGVQPKIEKLAGGQNLGEISDMTYWENLLIRGLHVPQQWVPNGPTENEARNVPTSTSTTLVQEQRFLKFCERIQAILIEPFNKEFKEYVKYRGIEIQEDSYDIVFPEPSNITELAEEELRKTRLETFNSAISNPYISKQFALKFYLKLSEEEFNENQRLLIIENQNKFKDKDIQLPTEDMNQVPGLRTIGIEDIPNDYLNDMKQNMTPDMGMGSGMGGADMGMGSGMSGADMGMGSEMGGADMGMGSGMGGADMGAGTGEI